ncbi:MAG TPA: hypothetical protein VLW65_21500 [Bryobacteraceae bacterium]|nr:hypothetical protein [Bryobacteraceae bacterium]
MFITLFAVTFVISALVSAVLATIFGRPIDSIMQRVISDPISQAWVKYVKFAIYVVGISSGVRIWELDQYNTPHSNQNLGMLVSTKERWVLEIYRTIIESLQAIAWLLLVFFVVTLIAFVIVRAFELRRSKTV